VRIIAVVAATTAQSWQQRASERAVGVVVAKGVTGRPFLRYLPTYLPTYLYPSFPFAPLIKFKCIYLAASAHTRAVDEIMVDCTLHSALCTGTTRRAGTPARQRLRRVIVAHDRRRSRRSEKIANVDARRAIILGCQISPFRFFPLYSMLYKKCYSDRI